MAGIGKIKNRYRVRYRLYYPDGTYRDRSRQVDKKGQARELKAQCDILESKTRLQEYTVNVIDNWWRNGLINAKDRKDLQLYPDGRKTQAADEYWDTRDVCKKEREARETRLLHIMECLVPIPVSTPCGIQMVNGLRHG